MARGPQAAAEARPGPRANVVAPASAARSVAGWPLLVLAQARPRLADIAWAWGQTAFGAFALRGTPGLLFARSLGSGHEGGFGLAPSLDRHGLFLAFDSAEAARRFALDSPTLQRWRERSTECCVLRLRTTRAKGSWGGAALVPPHDGSTPAPNATPDATPAGPVAALTRASIRPSRALAFWRHSPPSQASLAGAPGCRLAVGLGEAPLLRQCTFSLWDSAAAMDAYARTGAHQQAIAASHAGGFFSESMFLRFEPLALGGRWQGRDFGPLETV